MTVEDVIIQFKRKVIFRQYTRARADVKTFGTKTYKLYDGSGYTYNISVYLVKQTKRD
jgi:hypothetical protein